MGRYFFRCLWLRWLYKWRSPKRLLKKFLPDIRKVAKECGYAIAVHGSLKRDIDLIAVPWIEDAIPAEELVEAIEKKTGWFHIVDGHNPEIKPHGRKGWSIVTHGVHTYIDLSVLDRIDSQRLDWLDKHTSFVADGEYSIGPYKVGELRKMADDGITIDRVGGKG